MRNDLVHPCSTRDTDIMRNARCAIGALLLAGLVGCGGPTEDVQQLEARIETLEARMETLEERIATIDGRSTSARSLQESQAVPTNDGEDDPPEPVLAETGDESLEGGLVTLVKSQLANAAFIGVDDPEFGGTTVEGDETTATVRLYRAGLEDREFVAELLVDLGFSEEVLQAVRAPEGTGEAASIDGIFEAAWAASPEEFVINLRAV